VLVQVTVQEGDVKIQYVDLVYDMPDCKILDIGTINKNPEPGGHSSGFYQRIWPETWEGDAEFNDTTVHFEGIGSHYWIQYTDTGKYSVYVILKHYTPRINLWTAERHELPV